MLADIVAPEYEAEMVTCVEALTIAPVMAKVADVEPCGTVTDAGIVTAEVDFERLTVAPPVGATALSCTIPTADWPPEIAVFENPMLERATSGFTVRPAVTVAPE